LICHQRFTIKGPSSPCIYLAQLWRYGALNIGRTDLDTERKTQEWKEKEGGEEKGKGKWKRKKKRKRKEKRNGK